MEWLIINKDWLFSGIGVAVLGYILAPFFRKKKEEGVINNNMVNPHQTVNYYNGISPRIEPTEIGEKTMNKATIHVLFIDDEKFDNVEILRQAGWINTKRIKDIKCIDCNEVQTANIIFVDINGIGKSLFPKEQGLGVAAKIKELFPHKYVVVYSAQPQQLSSLFGEVDAILPKDADPYQYVSILENYISK